MGKRVATFITRCMMDLALAPSPSPSDSEEDSAIEEQDSHPQEPIGKRGQWSVVHEGKYYLCGGYSGQVQQSPPHEIEVFDFASCTWSVVETRGQVPKTLSGACSAVIGNCLYMFGGWYRGMRNSDVYELSLLDSSWRKLTEENLKGKPLRKDKAGMVDYGTEMLCIMGGYGYCEEAFSLQKGSSFHLDPNSFVEIGWTNELHLFHTKKCEWISPEMTGVRPLPCAAFSLTRVDQHRVVLFGGRQLLERTDQLHILDMENWHWSGVILPSGPNAPWPQRRSFHSACSIVDPNCAHFSYTPCKPSPLQRKHSWLPCLEPDLSCGDVSSERLCVDPKLLVLWGMDNAGNPVDDVWILNVNTLTWKKVELGSSAGPARVWHTAGAYHPAPQTATVLAVGGSDENIFRIEEEEIIHNVSKTSLLSFGPSKSLFEQTLKFIAEQMLVFPLLQQLPHHIVEAVQLKKKFLDTRKHFYCWKKDMHTS